MSVDAYDGVRLLTSGRLGMMDNELITRPVNQPAKVVKRRVHSAEFKAAVIAQCERGDESLASIALSHQLNATMVRKWVREHQAKRGAMDTAFVPVTVSSDVPPDRTGTVEVTLSAGRVRIHGAVDPQLVHAVLAALR